jgi:recombination associated protein RdgC
MSTPNTQLEKNIDKIVPEDIINTLQSGYKVFTGDADHLQDFLKHGGQLLRKASQRFTTTQLIIGVAVAASIAIIAVAKTSELDTDESKG